mgnify:FL=1
MPPPDSPQEKLEPFDPSKFKQNFLATIATNPPTPTQIISPDAVEMLVSTITENPFIIDEILRYACYFISSTEAFAKLYDTVPRSIGVPSPDGSIGLVRHRRKPTPTEFVSPKLSIAVITEMAKRLNEQSKLIAIMDTFHNQLVATVVETIGTI